MTNPVWKVPYNYLPEQFKNRDDIFDAWRDLANSAEFTLGPSVNEFENNFKKYIGSKYCIATNNGTDALILGLKALGVRPGDEIITVPNSFYATTGAIIACGAYPVFVDVDETYQMDVEKIQESITHKTRCILPVYWGGASPRMLKIVEIAKKNNLSIIEDACMAIGGSHKGIKSGRFGNVSAFSMHPLKSLNVMGDGGMITTDDDEIYEWLKKYRNHGMVDRDHIDIWGVNSRIQPLQAIVANIELNKIDAIIAKRNINARYLDESLNKFSPNINIPPRFQDDIDTFSLYMFTCKNRDGLLNFLRDNGIDAKIHYLVPLHLQVAAKPLGYSKGSFPQTELQANSIITIPAHQYLTQTQLDYMVEKIGLFYTQL